MILRRGIVTARRASQHASSSRDATIAARAVGRTPVLFFSTTQRPRPFPTRISKSLIDTRNLPPPRWQSTISHVSADTNAPREVPTPLILVSASQWTGEPASSEHLKAFEEHFSRHGWNVTHIDIDPPDVKSAKTSEEVLDKLESELAAQMRKAAAGSGGAPFPPIMMARGKATLAVEQYVSSHPLSGLVLLDPPLSPQSVHESNPEMLPTTPPAFTYEIRFPALCAWTQEGANKLLYWHVHRIEEEREDEADEALERFIWNVESSQDELGAGPHEMRKWAEDECGIAAQAQDGAQLPEEREEESNKGDKEPSEHVADIAPAAKPSESAREIPTWFTEGKYVRYKARKKDPLELDEKDIVENFIKGSGPGGQAINKTSSCVQLKHTPTGMILKCQETRERSRNRVIARRRLGRELELLVFGQHDSALGQEQLKKRRQLTNKKKKTKRRQKELASRKAGEQPPTEAT